MLFIKMLPLYGVILIVSSVFIYLLPGFCDPENNTEKRIPFLILSYLLMTLAFMVLLNINEKVLSQINGYLLYAPILGALISHIITIAPYFGQRSFELVLVTLILAEFELFVLIKNGMMIPPTAPYVGATLIWCMVYYRLVTIGSTEAKEFEVK